MRAAVVTGCGCGQRFPASQLGESDAETLIRLRIAALADRGGDAPIRLCAWLRAARAYGYTLNALGQAIGVRGERIRQLTATQEEVERVPPVAGSPAAPVDLPWPSCKAPWFRWPRPILSQQEVQTLRMLQDAATQCRGRHSASDHRRQGSERLTSMLSDLIDRRGFSYAELAEVLGVKKQTVVARMRRHGYRNLPPSQRAYQGASSDARRKQQVRNNAAVKYEIARQAGVAPPPTCKRSTDPRETTWRKLSTKQREFLTDLIDRGKPHRHRSHVIVTSRSLTRRGLLELGYGHRLTEAGRDLMNWVRSEGNSPQSVETMRDTSQIECGTTAGYEQHRRRREYCCKPCLRAVQFHPTEPQCPVRARRSEAVSA